MNKKFFYRNNWFLAINEFMARLTDAQKLAIINTNLDFIVYCDPHIDHVGLKFIPEEWDHE